MSWKYEVPEISCEHCKQTLETAVRGVHGVRSAVADVGARTVVVDGEAPNAAVVAAIEAAGYDVTRVVELPSAPP